ncbi:hypothetical protein [Kordia sp.]|uniref:hypothetical protein n=1 Tax=Kordia sp. TaxID=1965332 RepID=UPI003D6B9847
MKKRNLKSLSLNKKSISNLISIKTKGGGRTDGSGKCSVNYNGCASGVPGCQNHQ